jgi:glycosyltransferase involved in cell wall biosynthesis
MNVTSKHLVSVILPVYNGEAYLDAALKTIFDQDYRPLEVIIVDDGSVDRSGEVVRCYEKVRYFYQSNQGVAAARNRGIQLADGEFIAFLDQDDLWQQDKLTQQVNYLSCHPEVDCVISYGRFFIEPGTKPPGWLKADLLESDHPAYFPSALMARKNAFEKVGMFDVGYRMGSDADWFFRARRKGAALAVLPETLLYRRIHHANHSYDSKLASAEILKVVKASVDHLRGQDPHKKRL